MGLLNYLEFDGENSFEYGVFISGEGTFDAPKRRARKISIPGRDGDLVLDEGSFENIQVSYPAFIVARNQAEFKEKLEAFRSALLSKTGYVRLSDTYHKDEYRMAAYLEGLEVSPKLNNKAGNFTLVFDCKPQRFLKIGDLPVSVASGDVITNPTLFNAHPLIKFNSNGNDGNINFGSKQIKVLSAILGRVNLGLDVSGSRTTTRTWQDVITIQNAGSFNAGDTLRFNGGKVIFTFNFTPINVEVVSQGTDLKASWHRGSNNLELSLNNLEFPAGTDTTYSFTCDIKVKASQTPSIEGTETFTVTTSYSRDGVLTITWAGGNYSFGEYTYIQGASNYTGYGDSTKNSLEDVDIYVDLDIGEAYSIDSDDNAVSLNNFINLGSELPVLPSGSTTISYSNTISNVEITPRYWRV